MSSAARFLLCGVGKNAAHCILYAVICVIYIIMYETVDVVAALTPAAEVFAIDNDRQLYKPFFEIAEEFCIRHEVLIGGQVGINLLIGAPITKDSWIWNLYCENAYVRSKQLTDALAAAYSPHIPANTAAMVTNLRQREFTISVSARILFKVYAIDRHNQRTLRDLLAARQTPLGYFGGTVGCVGALMQLIDTYRTLYSISKVSQWPAAIAAEPLLWKLLDLTEAARGNATRTLAGDNERGPTAKYARIALAAASSAVIVADDGKPIIISEDAERTSQSIVRALTRKGLRASGVSYQLYIPNDFRILKHTVYVKNGDRPTAICDVYNSAQYELIPYTFDGPKRVASLWVKMRFLCIDAWISLIITGKHRLDSAAARVRATLHEDPASIWRTHEYLGVYTDEAVARKKFIAASGERFATYYPARASKV